jgi:hypothetical protein
VKSALRKTLADSHISAIAIAVLLLWSLDWDSELYGDLFPVLPVSCSKQLRSSTFPTFLASSTSQTASL